MVEMALPLNNFDIGGKQKQATMFFHIFPYYFIWPPLVPHNISESAETIHTHSAPHVDHRIKI